MNYLNRIDEDNSLRWRSLVLGGIPQDLPVVLRVTADQRWGTEIFDVFLSGVREEVCISVALFTKERIGRTIFGIGAVTSYATDHEGLILWPVPGPGGLQFQTETIRGPVRLTFEDEAVAYWAYWMAFDKPIEIHYDKRNTPEEVQRFSEEAPLLNGIPIQSRQE